MIKVRRFGVLLSYGVRLMQVRQNPTKKVPISFEDWDSLLSSWICFVLSWQMHTCDHKETPMVSFNGQFHKLKHFSQPLWTV